MREFPKRPELGGLAVGGAWRLQKYVEELEAWGTDISRAVPLIVVVDARGGPATYTLPADKATVTLKDKYGASADNSITVIDPDGALIDGRESFTISMNYASYMFWWSDSSWSIL